MSRARLLNFSVQDQTSVVKYENMKMRELSKVGRDRAGYINKNGVKSELNEEATFSYLTLFGLNIELIKPSSTKKAKNADVFIMGGIWEVKTPTSSNRNTIKNRFREASKQSTKVIFDLRFVENDAKRVQRRIIEMFENGGQVRRLMIIENGGKLLDLYK